MFKVCRDDMPCEVKKYAIWAYIWGGVGIFSLLQNESIFFES